MGERLSARLLPPSPLARRLSLQSGLYAVGTGVFITGNAVFFTQIVGLSAGEVGLGVSISGVVAVLTSVACGKLADRLGPLRVWGVSACGEALVYASYPWVRGFTAFVAVLVLLSLLQSAGGAGRTAYTLGAIPRGERVRTLAFVRSALNIGFTVGALFAGAALAVDSRPVIMSVPLVTAAVLLLNATLITRLPRPHEPEPEQVEARRDKQGAAIRNVPFLVLGGLNGVLFVDQVLLSVVLPLWLVERTDAPHALLAWLYGTNTLMVVLLQVRAARGSETVAGAARAARVAGVAAVGACVAAMSTYWLTSWSTVVVLWLAYVLVTCAELFHSASNWGFVAELSDPLRRAEYQGVWRLGQQVQQMVGPALFTFLAVTWHPEGFLVIGAVALAAALSMPPVARAAQRRLAVELAKPTRVGALSADTIEQSTTPD